MIGLKTVKRFCKEYWLIENYDQAMADETQCWHCHHRHEIDWALPRKELIAIGRYYDVHYSELIFLTQEEHTRLHKAGKNNPWYGKEGYWKGKVGPNKGKGGTFKGHYHTGESKQKMGDTHTKFSISVEELYDLYIVQGFTLQEIASMYGCSLQCIHWKLKKYNIKKNK